MTNGRSPAWIATVLTLLTLPAVRGQTPDLDPRNGLKLHAVMEALTSRVHARRLEAVTSLSGMPNEFYAAKPEFLQAILS